MPTRWAGYGVVALVLIATAAFGGLNDAPPDPVKKIDAGVEHTNEQVSMAVERIVLVDSIDDYFGPVEAGQPLLVLVLSVTNLTDQPLPMSGISNNVSVTIQPANDANTAPSATGGDEPGSIELTSIDTIDVTRTDGTYSTFLQSGVPARLAVIWAVNPDTVGAIGGEARTTVTIFDLTYGDYYFVSDDKSWDEPVASAEVDVTVETFDTTSMLELDGPVTQ